MPASTEVYELFISEKAEKNINGLFKQYSLKNIRPSKKTFNEMKCFKNVLQEPKQALKQKLV